MSRGEAVSAGVSGGDNLICGQFEPVAEGGDRAAFPKNGSCRTLSSSAADSARLLAAASAAFLVAMAAAAVPDGDGDGLDPEEGWDDETNKWLIPLKSFLGLSTCTPWPWTEGCAIEAIAPARASGLFWRAIAFSLCVLLVLIDRGLVSRVGSGVDRYDDAAPSFGSGSREGLVAADAATAATADVD